MTEQNSFADVGMKFLFRFIFIPGVIINFVAYGVMFWRNWYLMIGGSDYHWAFWIHYIFGITLGTLMLDKTLIFKFFKRKWEEEKARIAALPPEQKTRTKADKIINLVMAIIPLIMIIVTIYSLVTRK